MCVCHLERDFSSLRCSLSAQPTCVQPLPESSSVLPLDLPFPYKYSGQRCLFHHAHVLMFLSNREHCSVSLTNSAYRQMNMNQDSWPQSPGLVYEIIQPAMRARTFLRSLPAGPKSASSMPEWDHIRSSQSGLTLSPLPSNIHLEKPTTLSHRGQQRWTELSGHALHLLPAAWPWAPDFTSHLSFLTVKGRQ